MKRCFGFLIVLTFILFLLTCGAVRLHGTPRPATITRVLKHVSRKVPKLNFVHAKYPEFKGILGPLGPLAVQNRIADEHGLRRIETDWEIGELVLEGRLVPISSHSKWLTVAKLDAPYGYIFSDAAHYIEGLPVRLPSIPLRITSLVRSEEYQRLLAQPWIMVNGKRIRNRKYARNATVCENDGTSHCSIHTTGYGFDLSTRGLSKSQILKIAALFKKDKNEGLVELLYEPYQNHFHVMYISRT